MSAKLFQINDDTPVAMLTARQLRDYLGLSPEVLDKIKTIDENAQQTPKRYVHGVTGIKELFNCSYPTAHKLKETILKPAISQQGRVIVVDVDLAMQLFKEHKEVKSIRGMDKI